MNEWKSPLLAAISIQTQSNPNKVFIQDDQKKLTGFELTQSIDLFAQHLKNKDIVPGERFLIIMENSVDCVVAFLAIIASGGTAVVLDPRLPSVDLHKLITLSSPSAVLTSQSLMEKLKPELMPEIPVWDYQENLAINPNFHPEKSTKGKLDRDPKVCLILYTSGTSGEYKGVMIAEENILFISQTCEYVVKGEREWFCVLPLYHIYPLVCSLLTALVRGQYLKLITLEQIFQIFQVRKPTVIMLVPRILEFLLLKIKGDPQLQSLLQNLPKGILTIICGGAPLSEKVYKLYHEMGIPIFCGYGMTECSGLISFPSIDKSPVMGSVGPAYPTVQIKIDQPDESGVGQICTRGAGLMKGYFKNSQASAESMKDGWFLTGDLGYLNSEGYLFVTGRIKEVIVLPSGKKSMPENIESQYVGIKGIKELAVVGVPAKGQVWDEIHAAVIPENKQNTLQEIETLIQEKGRHLPFHLQIQKVHLVEEIPKTSTLKVRRAILKKQFQDQQKTDAVFTATPDDPIYQLLKNWIIETLGIAEAEVDASKPFTYYGIDSLSTWQLCEKVNEAYNMDIAPIDVMDHPTILQLAEFCKLNMDRGKSKIPPIFLADRSKELPLSIAEETHWQRGQDPWQNYLYGIELSGTLNQELLRKSFEAIFQRHEILRTTFHQKGDRLTRKISPPSKGAFHFFDLSHITDTKKQKDEFKKIVHSLRERPIDVTTNPLFYVTLIQLSLSRYTLILLSSRLIIDGMSLSLIIQEAAELYKELIEGKPISLQCPLQYQYADYANWQRTVFEQGLFQEAEHYWREQFQKMELVQIPGRKKDLTKEQLTQRENLIAGVVPLQLSEEITSKLLKISKKNHTSLPTILASIFQIALHIQTNSSNITIRELNADRRKTYLKHMIGYLNTGVGIVAEFDKDLLFNDFLQDHQKQLHRAMQNTQIYFDGLVGKWGSLIKGAPPYSLNVSYNFLSFSMAQNFGNLALSLSDLHLDEYLYPPGLELDFVLSHIPDGGIVGGMYYRKVLFDQSSIDPIAQNFTKIAHLVSVNHEISIQDIKDEIL